MYASDSASRSGHSVGQFAAERGSGVRALLQKRAPGGQEGVDVYVADVPGERAGPEATFQYRLHEWTKSQAVAGTDQVQRPAHQGGAYRIA